MKRFANKAVLITGGGSGIGAACARRMALEGAKIIVTGRRREMIEKIAHETGGVAIVGDTTDLSHLEEAADYAEKNFGGLDVLVANAGAEIHSTVMNSKIDDWNRAIEVNTTGVLLACQATIPKMQKKGKGAIVIVASMASLTGAKGGAPYVTSKAALLGLNRSIAVEHGGDNIRSNIICPGWAKTEMSERAINGFSQFKGLNPAEFERELVKYVPLQRMSDPSEMAAVVAFLASDDASFVTGTYLAVDGGAGIVDVGTLAFSG